MNRLIAPLAAVLLMAVCVGVSSARKHHSSGVLPSMGAQPSASIFGMNTDVPDNSQANFIRDIPAARQLGARYDHITLGPATASGAFAAVDYQVKAARKHHMGVILSFGGIATACSRPTSNPHACPPTTAHDLSVYKRYVLKMLLRYRHVVQYWESWAEPNKSSSWLGAPDPAGYARLLQAQYAVVQSVNRNYHVHLKLLFGSPVGFSIANVAGWEGVIPFADQALADLHGARVFDGAALHAYRLPPAAGPSAAVCDYTGGVAVAPGSNTPSCPAAQQRMLTWPEELTAYEQLFASHGYGAEPLWLTEWGWPGATQASTDVPDDSSQATYIGQALADVLNLPFVQGAFWFAIRDYQPSIQNGDPAYFFHFGLLHYDFSQKPAAATFTAFASAHPGR